MSANAFLIASVVKVAFDVLATETEVDAVLDTVEKPDVVVTEGLVTLLETVALLLELTDTFRKALLSTVALAEVVTLADVIASLDNVARPDADVEINCVALLSKVVSVDMELDAAKFVSDEVTNSAYPDTDDCNEYPTDEDNVALPLVDVTIN